MPTGGREKARRTGTGARWGGRAAFQGGEQNFFRIPANRDRPAQVRRARAAGAQKKRARPLERALFGPWQAVLSAALSCALPSYRRLVAPAPCRQGQCFAAAGKLPATSQLPSVAKPGHSATNGKARSGHCYPK
ncbi:hypothetical protein GCM10007167_11300 [Vulcaniibacterium thermophilum]|uniref:Uncharacterized protein n=1 Tax=Vulcaniibacterium thermophilum TaxID=1169913 RepID=A0A918Z068_9GAMM|nr:hypothetical protein GCM10007167_11300 [Vulcaniibacterium thermophilum]